MGVKGSGIGGQAVMEGVMMKNGDRYAVAVRKPDKEIIVKTAESPGFVKGKKFLGLPFVRGVFNFVDSLVLGMKTLTYSAGFFDDEEEEEPEKEPSKLEKKIDDFLGTKKGMDLLMGVTVAFSMVLAVAVFMILPYLLSLLLRKVTDSQSLIAACEGVLKIAIFMGYITLISRMKDIQRVFMYHGAEHKCINCIEHGMELNVENVMKSSREHKRCGTSFLLIVMVVSIILHMFIRVDSKTLGFVIRILLLPVVAGISYEFIRLAGTSDNRLVALLSKPGMALQHMTTREPGPDMVEVAIASVEAVFDWKKFLNENFGANYELTEKEYVVGETIVPGTEKKSAAQLKKTEEVTA
ncbi:Predicted metal-dependent enzyme [uncultured Clostridium sp.]|nr:Predicted metal-dependent enzyme [uncultured Clostridium sp.]